MVTSWLATVAFRAMVVSAIDLMLVVLMLVVLAESQLGLKLI
eukprot:COSAG06_NODE_24117_length_672_cov_1.064572_1_plen_42_part_00